MRRDPEDFIRHIVEATIDATHDEYLELLKFSLNERLRSESKALVSPDEISWVAIETDVSYALRHEQDLLIRNILDIIEEILNDHWDI